MKPASAAPRPSPGALRGTLGFTLLEVMAAVAVFGLIYVVIARAAIAGLGIEGDAQRRLRASLLADRALAQVELALRSGGSPALGREEFEEEEYRVVRDVAPLDPAQLGLAEALAPREEEALAPGSAAPPAADSLLFPPPGAAAPSLLTVQVRVSWFEGTLERSVTRTSFAFDLAAAAPLLEAIAPAEEPPEQPPEERAP